MNKQKYQVGDIVLFKEIEGFYKAVIIGFEGNNSAPYKINFWIEGVPGFLIEDVTEDQLISI